MHAWGKDRHVYMWTIFLLPSPDTECDKDRKLNSGGKVPSFYHWKGDTLNFSENLVF